MTLGESILILEEDLRAKTMPELLQFAEELGIYLDPNLETEAMLGLLFKLSVE